MRTGRLSFWLCAALLLFSRLPSFGPTSSAVPSSPSVRLGWNPSPDTNVVGYFVLFGGASQVYTNQFDAGNATSATIAGLQTNVRYYFTVVGYDALGQQSPPSNEIAYQVPAASPARAAPTLSLQTVGAGSSGAAVHLSFQASAATTYRLQATQDFVHWETLGRTNCAWNGLVAFCVTDMANYPRRFYRLSSTPGVVPAAPVPTLAIGPPPAGQGGAALRLSFSGSAGAAYDLQASRDFQQWTTLGTTNCASDGLIIFYVADMTNYPSRFYRVVYQ